jgi:histidinol dehydrogenase
MEIIKYPEINQWPIIIRRPVKEMAVIKKAVEPIMRAVKEQGDAALIHYTKVFDKVDLKSIALPTADFEETKGKIDRALISAIEDAIENIEKFHKHQLTEEIKTETSPGVWCWRRNCAIEKVGLYIPGGTAPLFSTIMMLAIPAKLAGCSEIIICTPPNRQGNIHPAMRYTAKRLGIEKIFRVGGAQAIAAMAYGTETIPQVYKIFGPGNQYVTAAKMHVNQEGTAIDMPAGPSEVVVLADATANPVFIAADLLSQAEHGADSQVILVTDSAGIIDQVSREVQRQLDTLPRKEIAAKALGHSRLILMSDLEAGMALVNAYAPEHLIIMSRNPGEMAGKVINAGSVFLGAYSPESAGDYASGTNHVLATNGFARSFSGVSLESFLKKITFQELSPDGLAGIGQAIEKMAETEELVAHKRAVSIRLAAWKKEKNGN